MKRFLFLTSALAHVLMSAQTEGGEGAAPAPAPAAPTDGTKIRPNLEGYQTAKSAGGSSTKICGDKVSLALLGATLDESYGFVAEVTATPEADLRAKYGDKNPGQQRMFLGNLIRGASQSKDAEKKARIEAAFDKALPAFREKIDTRLAAVAKEKEEAKAAKAKERQDAKDKAAAEKKAAADKRAKELADKKEADAAKAKQTDAGAKPAGDAKPATSTAQAKGPGTPAQPK
jgi:hypothetical protein